MTNHHQVGSAVFLSLVDDFVGPSQACVNPIFSKVVSDETGKKAEKQEAAAAKVIPQRRRRSRTAENGDSSSKKQIVTATIADCLACSGCVTTAETVLMEATHNLDQLKQMLLEKNKNVVLTISPASWADLDRHFQVEAPIRDRRRQWAALIQKTLGISTVLDGNVPLLWSRRVAADEFVSAYQEKSAATTEYNNRSKSEEYERDQIPSKALSATQTEYYVSNRIEVMDEPPSRRTRQRFPLITSSCPAITLLIEKSLPELVQHLSRVTSPMASMARTLHASSSQLLLVAVMPCHDKKLEASRMDNETDLVVTTSEFVRLLQERITDVPTALHESSSNTIQVIETTSEITVPQNEPILYIPNDLETATMKDDDTDVLFVAGSGGYADYIFRRAAFELFGIASVEPQWTTPVLSSSRRRKATRDSFEAVLIRKHDGKYTTCITEQGEIVWKFAIAYGLQSVQRVLANADSYMYIEAMACPGSCLNGAGQIRTSTIERPSESRQRMARTRTYFGLSQHEPVHVPSNNLYTKFHVVPPMQHTLGAAAGVAVQDTQW